MEIRAGGGVFGLGNPGRRGGLVVPEIRVEGGVKKSCHPSGGVWIFSGITHYNYLAQGDYSAQDMT